MYVPLMLLSDCYITVTGTALIPVCDRHYPDICGLVPHGWHDLHVVPRSEEADAPWYAWPFGPMPTDRSPDAWKPLNQRRCDGPGRRSHKAHWGSSPTCHDLPERSDNPSLPCLHAPGKWLLRKTSSGISMPREFTPWGHETFNSKELDLLSWSLILEVIGEQIIVS